MKKQCFSSDLVDELCSFFFLFRGLGRGVRQSTRIMKILLKTDAAPRILSAISTGLGSSLSPPVFGYHGDDVKLHHRFSPVDGLRGGATNPVQSSAGAIIP